MEEEHSIPLRFGDDTRSRMAKVFLVLSYISGGEIFHQVFYLRIFQPCVRNILA